MFNIAPSSGEFTPWHHDLPFWPVSGLQVVTIWLAFDRVVEANGAMKFIRGSHRWGKRFRPYSTLDSGVTREQFEPATDDGSEPVPDFDAEPDRYEILSFDLEPGDAIAFHALTVHASSPNTTLDKQRRAYAMRFTGDEVRYDDRPVWNVYIVNPTLNTGDSLDSDQYPVVYDVR